jgi:hypothetical protein
MLREGLPEMLWSITNLDGDRFDELPVQKVVGGAIHPLLAYERLPIHILVPQDALDVALGITKLKRDVAQTQMAIGQITTQDASDVDDNGGVLCAGLGSNGHKNAVADRSATLDIRALPAPCQDPRARSSRACSAMVPSTSPASTTSLRFRYVSGAAIGAAVAPSDLVRADKCVEIRYGRRQVAL